MASGRGGLTIGAIVIRCFEFDRMLAFWRAALHYVPREPPETDWVVLCDPSGSGPNLSLDRAPDRRTGRRGWLHLDLYAGDREGEVERLVGLGATRYPWRYPAHADYVVLEDPDGNLFCVVQVPGPSGEPRSAGRGSGGGATRHEGGITLNDTERAKPKVVSMDEWQAALDRQIEREKAATRERDALSAARRRLPMAEVDAGYAFEGPNGQATLLDLFEGRRQLIVYHFMFGPDWEAGCDGCSWVVDAMTHPAHLHARDTSIALVSRAPLAKLERYRERMGWRHVTWYSSSGSTFNVDMGVSTGDATDPTTDRGERHGVSVFLSNAGRVFRTYFTGRRGVEHLGSLWTYLDLTPYGRQETWEDSPEGWPQTEPYVWNRRHDEY
jgi:predicted dithiol-disulfide oxidoreductase (DUF899 family)